jgi:DNA-binding CsgD family transcriptional regulator
VTRTISERLSEAVARDFVGRERELALIRRAATDDRDVLVVFVHGPGGIGKTRLVRTALGSVPPSAPVVALDCRDIEPTPRGFLEALAAELGAGRSDRALPRIAELVGDGPGRTAIALDAFEVFYLMDSWLRQAFLPAMPDSVLTVIAGRDSPGAPWLSSPGWSELVREVRLGPLAPPEAMELLRRRGLTGPAAARANRFAHGHPLALELVAAAYLADTGPEEEDAGPPPIVVERLLDALVAGLPADTLATLEAGATSRRVTEPILRALLDRDDVRREYDDLRRLPFVERAPDGLRLHDVVHEAVMADLAERDPETDALYRRRAWRFFAERARQPPPDARWETTADIIYLIRNPVLRSACFPPGGHDHAVEPAAAADRPGVLRIFDAWESPAAAELLCRWLDRHPEQFFVARGAGGEVDAVLHLAELAQVDPGLLAEDPVAGRWREHLAAVPARPRDRVLVMRRCLGRESGEMLSPPVGALWLDVKRVYLQLRPRLSRLYSAFADFGALAPILGPLGFAAAGAQVPIAGASVQPVWLDFGEGSVDGWLARLVGAELDAADEQVAGARAGGSLETLSRRERQVLLLIADGLTNRQIAERLVISDKTVGRHVANVFAKLGVHNRVQATRIAAEHATALEMA